LVAALWFAFIVLYLAFYAAALDFGKRQWYSSPPAR
jgi:hypothetical protein